jgi:hypothetical protein
MKRLLLILAASAMLVTVSLRAETRALPLFLGNTQKVFDAASRDRVAVVVYGIPETDQTILGLSLTCPAGWTYDGGATLADLGSFVGAGLNSEPENRPALGASGTLTWSYRTPVSSAAWRAFIVYLKHAATCTGYQTFTPQITFRDSRGATQVNGGQALTLDGLLPLAIATQPTSQAVAPGARVTLSAGVNDLNRTTVVWKKDGVALPEANVTTSYHVAAGTANVTGATYTLTIASASSADAGSYTLVATRDAAELSAIVTSDAARLTVTAPATASGSTSGSSSSSGAASSGSSSSGASGSTSSTRPPIVAPPSIATTPPTLTRQPQAQSVSLGAPVTLSIAFANGGNEGVFIQWARDGVPISGATSPTLTLPAASLAESGNYSVTVTNGVGTVTSDVARVTVLYAQLINLSASASLADGEQLIVGYSIAGSAPRTLALRGVGPSLGAFGVTGFLRQPHLTVHDNTGRLVATADSANGNTSVTTTFARVGAFPLGATAGDVALVRPSAPGNFSAQLDGAARTSGVALAEIYDADTIGGASRLTNLSARARVGSGAEVLIAGFVLAGNTSKAFLLRAVGPGLGAFGITNPLARPALTVFDARGNAIASNAGWTADTTQVADLSSAMQRAGAFPLSANTGLDAAVVLTLAPGNYTAQVSGAAGSTGLALFELYELP